MSGFIFNPFFAPGFLALGNQAGLVVLDGADAAGWSLTAIGNVTVSPQNLLEGEKYSLRFTQDGTGDRTLSVLGSVAAEAEGTDPLFIAGFSTEYTLTATSASTWEVTGMAGGATLALVTSTFIGKPGIGELFCDGGPRTVAGDPLIVNDWATGQGKPDPANAERTARWSLVAFGSDFSVSRWIEMYCVGDGGIPDLPVTARIDLPSTVAVSYEIRHEDSSELSLGAIVVGPNIRMSTAAGALRLGFYGAPPLFQPVVVGSRVLNPALASLLTALGDLGLILDATTP